VTVALRTAGDAAFPAAGYLVTVAIGTNPAGGTLTGTTVVATDDNGVASFGDLSIDTPGTYTLTATSPGLISATSAAFTITAASLLGAAQGYSRRGHRGEHGRDDAPATPATTSCAA